MKSLKLHTTICAFSIVAFLGCTDLKEQVIDEVLGANNSNPVNALAAAYGQMDNATFVDHSRVFALQEYATDEALLPTRGSDWGDGGVWRAIHEFTWGPDNSVVTNTWNDLNSGITQALTAIKSISKAENFADKAQYLAEAKTLLAFYTYHLLDLYGQAPYRNPNEDNALLEVRKAPATIDELIKEVESELPNLAEPGQNKTHNGRFTKQAAWAFLADMYLNRAVLKDRYAATFNFNEKSVDGNSTDMDKVIEYTTRIIESGKFQLETNFFKNFDIDNNGRSELIFVVSQDVSSLRSSSNSFAYMPMERIQKPSPANRGTNATCTTPEFYATWNGNHDDPRFHRHYQYSDGTWFMNDGTDVSVPATSTVAGTGKTWFHFNRGVIEGQQYGPNLLPSGDFEKTSDGRVKVVKLFCEKNTTLPANFTPELNFDKPVQSVFTQAQINRGVRIFKYEFDPENGSNGNSNVDIPLYRLGGMYSMRAEAYFRKGQPALALDDINKLRTNRTREALYGNAPGKPINALDEQTLYNEGGFEMYWEMYRRKQAIRFGKFDAAGTAKPKSEPYRRVYPIPQSTLDASKVFTQNEGY